ncbi:hypothetical protein EIP91_009084 [Steccherinum ochraceum]|uniref:Pentacotripeptide-repeat region of PRORP domain-containing protein n=1 Tax=Steccherinum ochraceum TaxID=92696 RepID=A0A4R0RKK6_9APHY|nr:hypothetical protein EIP91_009084 [Steccherinum ochraceum]
MGAGRMDWRTGALRSEVEGAEASRTDRELQSGERTHGPVNATADIDWSKVANMSARHLKMLIEAAAKHGRPEYLDSIIQHVLTDYASEDRFEVLSALLALSTLDGGKLLSKKKLRTLVQDLQSSNKLSLSDIPKHVLLGAATATLSSPVDRSADFPLIVALWPHILPHCVAPGTHDKDRLPAHPAWILIAFTHRLMILDCRVQALECLKILMANHVVPERASRAVSLSVTDFEIVTTTILANACTERGWFLQALSLFTDLLDKRGAVQEHTFHLGLLVVSALLHSSDPRRLQASARTLSRLLTSSVHVLGKGAALQKVLAAFYKQAQTPEDAPTVETIYALTTLPSIRAHHTFPPPRGPTLLSLFLHICETSQNTKLARLLAQQIADEVEDVEIPFNDRDRLIAAIASAGFAGPARALWERFAVREGARRVLGSAKTMMRLVSLFTNLARRRPYNGSEPPAAADDMHGQDSLSDVGLQADVGDEIAIGIKMFTEALELRQSNLKRAPPDSAAAAAISSISVASPYIDDPIPNPIPVPSDATHPHAQDLYAFAHRVIAAFHHAKQPLHLAHHFDLNALARAYFLLSAHTLGFRVLLTIARHQPHGLDIHDANVALSAIARCDATRAAEMLGRMAATGLDPDAVSFGTVIHYALVQENVSLAKTLLARARERRLQLSYQTIGALLHRCAKGFSGTNTTTTTSTTKAKEDLDLVLALVAACNPAPSARMGLDCVATAVRADDPVRAVAFWRLLVKDKMGWKKREHVEARRRVAESIRCHVASRSLGEGEALKMLAELREGVVR